MRTKRERGKRLNWGCGRGGGRRDARLRDVCVCVCGLCEHKSIFMLRGFMHTGACEDGL